MCVCSAGAHVPWCACGGSRAVLWSQVTLPRGFWGLNLDCQPCTASAFTPEPSRQSLEVNVYALSMSTIQFLYWLPTPLLCVEDCQANTPQPTTGLYSSTYAL